VIVAVCLSFVFVSLSVCLSVSGITHECVNGRRPNMVEHGRHGQGVTL